MSTPYQPQRILIIRFSSIGDIVLTFPLIATLRKHFPDSRIDYVVHQEYAELLQAAPRINTIFTYDRDTGFSGLLRLRDHIHRHRYDLILDLHYNLRSRVIRFGFLRTPVRRIHKQVFRRWLLIHLKWNLYHQPPLQVAEKYLQTVDHLGIPATIPPHYFTIPDEVRERLSTQIQALLLENYRVVIAPGARHATKQWPLEYYQEFIEQIFHQYGWRTILLGSASEKPLLERLAAKFPTLAKMFPGTLSLLESAAIIEALPYFVSNDSGFMHIAAALHKPQIAIFGPTVQEFGFYPLNDRAIVIDQPNLPCRPCSHLGSARCPKGHFRCMRDSTPQRVLTAFADLVRRHHLHN